MNKKVFLQKLNHSLVYAKGLGALAPNAFFLFLRGSVCVGDREALISLEKGIFDVLKDRRCLIYGF